MNIDKQKLLESKLNFNLMLKMLYKNNCVETKLPHLKNPQLQIELYIQLSQIIS